MPTAIATTISRKCRTNLRALSRCVVCACGSGWVGLALGVGIVLWLGIALWVGIVLWVGVMSCTAGLQGTGRSGSGDEGVAGLVDGGADVGAVDGAVGGHG